MLSMLLRPNKWKGARPAGDWKSRALTIDFGSTQAIQIAIPPYSGTTRYGQLPFPLGRLIN